MPLLIESRDSLFLAVGSIGLAFIILESILEIPAVWKHISVPFFALADKPGKEFGKPIHSGLLFRLVCTLHNAPVSILSLLSLTNSDLWRDSINATSSLAHGVIIFSCGFFVWDVFAAIKKRDQEGTVPIFHGIVCFSFLLFVLCSNKCQFYGCAAISWEVSTLFLHFRWLLFKIEQEKTPLYFYNGITSLITFGIFRIIWGIVVSIKYVLLTKAEELEQMSAAAKWFLLLVILSGNGLNIFWYRKMLIVAINVIRGKKADTEKKA